MSPIPPNKNESFDGSKNGVGEENVNVSEEVTTNTEEAAADGWDPNYYAVGYNYRQLNQSEPVNADAKESESDEESELPELDPDVEFEILAETRSTNKIKKIEDITSGVHILEKDVFAKKVELECEEIPLDASKSQTISHLMSGFQLPESAMPDWAKSVPEEVWKKNLLASLNAKKTDLFTQSSSAGCSD